MMSKEKRNPLTLILFVMYLLALVWLVVFKLTFVFQAMTYGRSINLIPLQGSLNEVGLIRWGEIRDNILAFVPLGIYVCLLWRGGCFARKVLLVFGVSLAFEVIQYVLAIGASDVTDLISNALGGIIGMGICMLLKRLFKGKAEMIINIAAMIVAVRALVLVASILSRRHGLL